MTEHEPVTITVGGHEVTIARASGDVTDLRDVEVDGEPDLILRTDRTERGTRWYWSGKIQTIQGVQVAMRTKAHHWGRNRRTGRLVLLSGPDPFDMLADR